MKILITEKQFYFLEKLLKIQEQNEKNNLNSGGYTWAKTTSKTVPDAKPVVPAFDPRTAESPSTLNMAPRVSFAEEQVKKLFDDSRKWPSTKNDWLQVKPYAEKMYKAMKGVWTNVPEFMTSFKMINTEAKLAALVKNFIYDGYDLFTWIKGESQLNWQDILNLINTNFKGKTESSDPNYIIANKIYLADRTLWDDEGSALQAIYEIKTPATYDAVNGWLKKLTNKNDMTIGKFLRGFTKMNQRLDVFWHLRTVLPKELKSIWIPDLIPFDDFKYLWTQNEQIPLYFRLGFGGEEGLFYFNKYFQPETASQSNAATELIKFYTLSDQWKNKDSSVTKELTHDIVAIAASIFDMAGIPGAVISFLIMAFDAKLYIDEGNTTAAYCSILFGLIGLGLNVGGELLLKNVARKLSQEELLELGNRLARGETNFTREELEFLAEIINNQKKLKEALTEPVKVWKEILSDPKLKMWKDSLAPEEWAMYHKRIMNGELSLKDIYTLVGGSKIDKALLRDPYLAKWFNNLDKKTQELYRKKINRNLMTLEDLKTEWRHATDIVNNFDEAYVLDNVLDPDRFGRFKGGPTKINMISLQEKIFFDIADELGLSIEKKLGSGAQGFAFKTTDGRVLKITQNPQEVSASLRSRTRTTGKQHLSIADVKPLRINGQTTKYYILTMDYLTTLTRDEKFIWEKWYDDFFDNKISDKKFIEMVKQEADAEEKAFLNKFISQRKNINKNLEKMNIFKAEAHGGNVGFNKHGNFVVFDYWEKTDKWLPGSRSFNYDKWAYQQSLPINIDLSNNPFWKSLLNVELPKDVVNPLKDLKDWRPWHTKK